MSEESSALASVVLAASACMAGCGGESVGTVVVEVSGEEAPVVGFPAGDIAFVDGWSIDFDHIFVAIEGFYLADGDRSQTLDADNTVIDLTDGDQVLWTFPGVPAQRWSDVEYVITEPTATSRRLGTVTEADVAALTTAGVSFRMIGTATHPTHGDYDFDVAIPMSLHASECVSGRDGTDGIVVPANGTHQTQITLHLDHLFFDSARAEEPNLRFEAWAAVAGEDNLITYSDLASQNLADLVGIDGMPLVDEAGAPIAYEPPASGLPAQNLQAFLLAEAFTIGHFEGEGHCDYHDHDAH
jgi:hypothetical protein